jgi:uncharacterized protein (DUF1015 family)
MLYRSKWYSLQPIKNNNKQQPCTHTNNDDDPLNSLDVQILYNSILYPIFGMKDMHHEADLSYLSSYTVPIDSLQHYLENNHYDGHHSVPPPPSDAAAAAMSGDYCVFPVDSVAVEEVIQISNYGGVMPPKATCFEPKVPPGIFLTYV